MPAASILLPTLLPLILVGALWRARNNTEWFISLMIAGGFVSYMTGQYVGFMSGVTVALSYLFAGGLIAAQSPRWRR